jgi:plasmid stabilization system protein ParE
VDALMLKIRYTKLAAEDLKNGYEHIFADNRSAARDVIVRVMQTLDLLASEPRIGHPGRVKGTYEFLVLNTPYIIVYMVEGNELIVVSFLHTSRRYPE